MRLGKIDPCSFAEPDVHKIKNMHLSLNIDFDKKILSGRVDLQIEKLKPEINELLLDVKNLEIKSISDADTKEKLDYKISDDVPVFGQKLTIHLSKNTNDKTKISITYEIPKDATGLQWLEPNQTSGKKHPFLFSQFQSIHARSFVPCQDTPAVKMPFTAEITAPSELTVLMGALRKKTEELDKKKTITFFEQKIPIPAYLIALCAGNLESKQLGSRCAIWAEPEVIADAEYEFGECETMLKMAEDICGPYVWGFYDLLVLPPSFPFGGMENPCLTFVTPTLLAGDRSLATVVAHEIAHSWTGNLVTNVNFEHFWLNEGFTVFTERKIVGRMKGPQDQDFEAICGLNTLQETVNKLGEKNQLTKLVVDLDGVHPDDSFSSIPYEKGSLFLRYLEQTVGGPDSFEPFFKKYLDKFKYQSITTEDFKKEFKTHFAKNPSINDIDWNTWLFNPGMPPTIPKYDSTLIENCEKLKQKWIETPMDSLEGNLTLKDIQDMSSRQVTHFLQLLVDLKEPLPVEKLKVMDKIYNISQIKNSEIKFRWLRLIIKAKWSDKVTDCLQMVTEVGRMKYIRPLYQELYNWEEMRSKAIATFKANRKYMMHVSAYTVAQDLHLSEDVEDKKENVCETSCKGKCLEKCQK